MYGNKEIFLLCSFWFWFFSDQIGERIPRTCHTDLELGECDCTAWEGSASPGVVWECRHPHQQCRCQLPRPHSRHFSWGWSETPDCQLPGSCSFHKRCIFDVLKFVCGAFHKMHSSLYLRGSQFPDHFVRIQCHAVWVLWNSSYCSVVTLPFEMSWTDTPITRLLFSLWLLSKGASTIQVLGFQQNQTAQSFCVCSFNVALQPHRPCRLFGTVNPGRPPRLSHTSWALCC